MYIGGQLSLLLSKFATCVINGIYTPLPYGLEEMWTTRVLREEREDYFLQLSHLLLCQWLHSLMAVHSGLYHNFRTKKCLLCQLRCQLPHFLVASQLGVFA